MTILFDFLVVLSWYHLRQVFDGERLINNLLYRVNDLLYLHCEIHGLRDGHKRTQFTYIAVVAQSEIRFLGVKMWYEDDSSARRNENKLHDFLKPLHCGRSTIGNKMSWDTSPKTGLFSVLLTSKGGNIAFLPHPLRAILCPCSSYL